MTQVALVNNSVIGYPTADSIEVKILGTEGPVPCKSGGAVQWHIQVVIVFKHTNYLFDPKITNIYMLVVSN